MRSLPKAGIKNLDIVYRCIDGRYPDGSGVTPARLPRRKPGVRVRHRAGSRAALVTRMWRTAELQVEEIEDHMAAAGLFSSGLKIVKPGWRHVL